MMVVFRVRLWSAFEENMAYRLVYGKYSRGANVLRGQITAHVDISCELWKDKCSRRRRPSRGWGQTQRQDAGHWDTLEKYK
ncbi:uncharacterized protein Dvir_GJ25758, isoform A [Drosophila virilis]|uniref:Uncharacterized protein, isoform A n=1 Tax=Drosophila virilis TaxID=7244 RepID=A0A0Q9W3M4_DROVI|nr:uncharacterized protein Dvir_GJ25758, isoform A [Drosophila virilis]